MTSLEREPLSRHTTLALGGPAARFCAVSDTHGALEALARARASGLPVYLLGGGSNLVVADEGVEGCVLALRMRGVWFDERGTTTRVRALAGEPWDALVAACVARGLAGVECLSGIPGSVGATPLQNVGAYGQEVGEVITGVELVSREDASVVRWSREECGFGYRDSRFKGAERDRWLVTAVELELGVELAPPAYEELRRELAQRGAGTFTVRDVRETVLELRARKSMVLRAGDENARSCGSFFLNPVVAAREIERVREAVARRHGAAVAAEMPVHAQRGGSMKVPAAWLIERAGFARGYRRGSVGLSTKHALALVAHEGATTHALLSLAHEVREGVEAAFGVTLRPEPEFWGFTRFDRGLPRLS